MPNADDSTTAQVSADVTWSRGAHTVKAGVQAYRLSIDFLSSQRSSGIFNFNGQYTGDAFADFLLGYASSASLSKWATLNFDAPYTHVFAQDDWRVSRRLTLNLGLRYEINLPPVDEHDAIANFDLDTDPAAPRIVLAGEEGDDRRGRSLQGINHGLFAPRAGFAYSLPGDKTVIRGGVGLFYGNLITVGGMSSLEINPPNHLRIARTTDRTVPSIFLSQGFGDEPAGRLERPRRQPGVLGSQRPLADRDQWNLNVQRELPARFVVEVGVQGNRPGEQLAVDRRQPGAARARQHQQPAAVSDGGDSRDERRRDARERHAHPEGRLVPLPRAADQAGEALRARAVGARRLRVVADHGRSRAATRTSPTRRRKSGPASTDRTHHFVASGVYELPFGRDRRFGSDWRGWVDAVLGGWSVSPIVTLTSGAPLDLSVNGNPSNSNGTDRPNVVGDWRLDDPTAERWFDTTAFVGQRPVHLRRRAEEPAARARLRQPRHRDPQGLPAVDAGHRRPALRIVQRRQPRQLRQPQHAGGQPELRPHLVGRIAPQQPDRREAPVLTTP